MARKWFLAAAGLMAAGALIYFAGADANGQPATPPAKETRIDLPRPRAKGAASLEETLRSRRSVRNFANAPLTLAEAGQLLWAAQGVTSPEGFRTAPSAGALYPLETYLVAGSVQDLAPGVYRYSPERHDLTLTATGDKRKELAKSALGQLSVQNAPATIVFTAVFPRTMKKYGQRGIRYVHIEAGHASQNVCLQAAALNLGTVPVGAFRDEEVKQLLNASGEEEVLYVMPVGRK